MSDNASSSSAPAEAPETPHGEEAPKPTEAPTPEAPQEDSTDWKAEARKWEARAKENKKKAAELDALARERMSEDEKRAADLEAATKERDEATARAEAAEAALLRYKIAAEFKLDAEDAEALEPVSDEAALRRLAERLAGRSNAAPRPVPAQGKGGGEVKGSTADQFAETLMNLF